MKLTKYVGWKKEKLEYFTLLYIKPISIIAYYVVEYYDGLNRVREYHEREDETCYFLVFLLFIVLICQLLR